MEEVFDLKDADKAFDFVFRLYNVVSLAHSGDRTLSSIPRKLNQLRLKVKDMKLPSLTAIARKRKAGDNADLDDRAAKKRRGADGDVESDILSDEASLEALERAGYKIPPEVEGFSTLLPVRVSFL